MKEKIRKIINIFKFSLLTQKIRNFFPKIPSFAFQFWILALRNHTIEKLSSIFMFTYILFVEDWLQSKCSMMGWFKKFINNSIRKFHKLIRNWIRFEGKMIWFVRFKKFSIWLIRKPIFDSKHSRKNNSKFIWFDSTPPLLWFKITLHLERTSFFSEKKELGTGCYGQWTSTWSVFVTIWATPTLYIMNFVLFISSFSNQSNQTVLGLLKNYAI